ncbi:MAG TPA: thiamine pyrophosphate-dependent enzyme [Candidatus Thermoplasmatota archaeon]|nr:thiamine pyrophosphate-dependent enzyme [Candidatus Thermoplasmatota archaeon]
MAPELLQVIGDGQKAKKDATLDLSDQDLLKMYRTMVLVRNFDNKMMTLQRQGRIGFYLAGTGQEADQIGAAYALEPDDWMFPHYRDPGAAMIRGVTTEMMAHNCFGSAQDTSKGRQMPVHYSFKPQNFFSVSSPLATQVIQAVGTAHAMKYRGDKKVVMTTFGDGSSSEGDFHVAMNWAGVYKLPCVFILENNQWAISVPLKFQTASETFAQKATAYGFEGVRVDGNDVLAVYKAVKKAVDKARSGGGPTLVECFTFRMTSHSSSDDNTRYCPPEMFAEWKKKDPIDRFERYLRGLNLLNDASVKKIADESEQEVAAAIKSAEAAGPPATETILEDVYGEPNQMLTREMQDLKREMKGE